ncbi:hypothetical protein [Promicromonospora sp. AC04]|nr:hypothetical protein [Promicromonospora sp. AC04]
MGEVNVDGASGQLRVDLRDQAGRPLWATIRDLRLDRAASGRRAAD